MKYLCLAYEEERTLDSLSGEQWTALRQDTLDYVEDLRRSGRLVITHALQSVQNATTVRVRQRPAVDDGRSVRRDQGDARRLLPDRGERSQRGDTSRRKMALRTPRQHRGAPDRRSPAAGKSLRRSGLSSSFPATQFPITRRIPDGCIRGRFRASGADEESRGLSQDGAPGRKDLSRARRARVHRGRWPTTSSPESGRRFRRASS